jgi:hypothetical protein
VVLAVRLVPVVRVAQVALVVQVVRLVPVVRVAQVAHLVQRVLALVAHAQASAVAPVVVPEQVAVSARLALAVAQVPAVVAVSAVEPLVHSVRVARVETRRPASPSARNAKSLNKELRRA